MSIAVPVNQQMEEVGVIRRVVLN